MVGGYIPLTTFVGPYWERGIEEDLRQYAPLLYAQATAPGSVVPALSPADEQRGWMRYGLFAASLMAGAMIASFIGVVLDVLLVLVVFALTRRR